jgi:hypothetical protein
MIFLGCHICKKLILQLLRVSNLSFNNQIQTFQMNDTKTLEIVSNGNTFFIEDQAYAYQILSKLAIYICIF